MKVRVKTTLTRNEKGRLRVGGMEVQISPQLDEVAQPGLERCQELFEDFCVVTQSIRQGIPVKVEVR
jgi:organic hydroperoxide reductase OsmC/OhrA